MDPSIDTKTSKARSRSSTAVSSKSRKRPLSRASTTSAHSGMVQPSIDQQHFPDSVSEIPKQWYDHNAHIHHQRFGGLPHDMTAEDMVIHSTNQLQDSRVYGIDPALAGTHPHHHHHHSLSYASEVNYKPEGRQSLPADVYYGEDNSQLMEGRSDEQDDVDSVVGPNGPAKKPSKSSAANEMEMRQLFQQNKERTLPDVAAELHGNERGPQSERQRQVFAMLWINQVCAKGKGSVPRGRVYASYVSRCATERVTVLNPASFGKLVRVLFPGLKTRRLGVRGESKYHYVNFSLSDDQPEMPEPQRIQPATSFQNSPGFATSFPQSIPSNTQFSMDRAAFQSPDTPEAPEPKRKRTGGLPQLHSLYNQPEIVGVAQLESTTSKMAQPLHFASGSDSMSNGNQQLSLPKIENFLPSGTDPDSARSLTALYRSHCTSLVDALRYCKEKTFFHLYTSFHGTLTMPVQKLFANHSIAPWIEECDFVMYQKMMRVVAPLTLQVAPKPVLDTLRNISERLVPHIQNCFQGHSSLVISSKVAPATLFAALLDRELRVNLTAHAAANMLSNPANRDQMYLDWITMVRTRKVAECVPTKGMDDVVNLLLTELRDLLDPVAVSWEAEGQTLYGQMALRTGHQQQASIHADSSTENVLDRWVNFLTSLPGKFPYATHTEIVWCVQRVGTAVMRDITIAQGKSFGAWWVTKCWIDEMITFMAEQGGFMEYKTSRSSPNFQSNQKPQAQQNGAMRTMNHHETRYSSGSDEYLRATGHVDVGMHTSRPMEPTSQAAMNAAAGHDDSGIGPEEDFAISKYDYSRPISQVQHGMHGISHLAQAAML